MMDVYIQSGAKKKKTNPRGPRRGRRAIFVASAQRENAYQDATSRIKRRDMINRSLMLPLEYIVREKARRVYLYAIFTEKKLYRIDKTFSRERTRGACVNSARTTNKHSQISNYSNKYIPNYRVTYLIKLITISVEQPCRR